MKITPKTTREELAAIVVQKLNEHQINAVLVGGSVVSIYTNNRYESSDLDFISSASHKKIKEAMTELGFESNGKDFFHSDTKFTVEFPTGPIGIGDEQPVIPEGNLKVGSVNIVMLSPTQSVMDRLAWFFHCNDRQCLDQAVWIAEKHPISFEKVELWAQHEGQEEKFKVFLGRLNH
jgi:hypothetical protein